MLNIKFEERAYPRQEIGAILGVDPKDKKFADKIKRRLTNLGFIENDDFIYTRKEVIILRIPKTIEERIEYLVRLLGIDRQVDVIAFSTFVYRLAFDPDFQTMPWEERATYLKDNDDIEVSEKTLRSSWGKKLIDLNIVMKDESDYEWWCTVNVDGTKVRSIVETDEEKAAMKEYWEFYWGVKKEADVEIKDKKERGQYIFNQVWGKFHCKYYKCKRFIFCAWQANDVIEELLDLIEEYIEDRWTKLLEK